MNSNNQVIKILYLLCSTSLILFILFLAYVISKADISPSEIHPRVGACLGMAAWLLFSQLTLSRRLRRLRLAGVIVNALTFLFALVLLGNVTRWRRHNSDIAFLASVILVMSAAYYLWFFTEGHKPPTDKGHCANCGYCLTGNRSGVCPECGTRISAASD